MGRQRVFDQLTLIQLKQPGLQLRAKERSLLTATEISRALVISFFSSPPPSKPRLISSPHVLVWLVFEFVRHGGNDRRRLAL